MSDLSGSLDVSVTRTRADYRDAIVRSFMSSGPWPTLIVLSSVVAAGFIFVTGISRQNPTVLTDALREGLLVFAVVGLLGLATALLTAHRFSSRPGAFDALHYSFSDQSVTCSTANGASTTQWTAWERAEETAKLFLLFSKRGVIHILPKRDLTPDQSMRLRILLNNKLGDGVTVFVEHRA